MKRSARLAFLALSIWLVSLAFGPFEVPGALAQGGDQPDQDIWQPVPGTTWQWQLSGPINTSYEVNMYDVDLVETPQTIINRLHAGGRIVICYFSAGSYEEWRPDADQFPPRLLGRDLDGWPGERWLDIRRIDLLAPIMTARLDLAVSKDCDGVEPDNVDGYRNSTGFHLTAANQLTYNRWLATEAHQRGLSIGLKNDLDQVIDLVEDYDWALNEECFAFDECELLRPFIQAGKAVFGVEYEGDPEVFCPRANALGFSWLIKTLDLGDEPPHACQAYSASPTPTGSIPTEAACNPPSPSCVLDDRVDDTGLTG